MDSMPKKFKKLLINDHCNNIRESGSINEVDLRPPADDELLIKNNFGGVNATDMNIMMGRSNLFSKSNLPHDLGLEVIFQMNQPTIDWFKNFRTKKIGPWIHCGYR